MTADLRDVGSGEDELRLIDELLHDRRRNDTDEVQRGFVGLQSKALGLRYQKSRNSTHDRLHVVLLECQIRCDCTGAPSVRGHLSWI